MSSNLRDVVSDWGGFEEFVKEIHEGDDVVVERDVTLTGLSGAPRQLKGSEPLKEPPVYQVDFIGYFLVML